MSLFIFKYCLPVLLGYTLFVGLAGRLNPFARPADPEEKPSWLLGIWTGFSVSLVLSIGLHMAYGMSLDNARALLKPSALFLSALLLPGFIGYLLYRKHIRDQQSAPANSVVDNHLLSLVDSDLFRSAGWRTATAVDQPDSDEQLTPLERSEPLDQTLNDSEFDSLIIPENPSKLVATFLESTEVQTIENQFDCQSISEAINDDSDTDNAETLWENALDQTVFEEFEYDADELDAAGLYEDNNPETVNSGTAKNVASTTGHADAKIAADTCQFPETSDVPGSAETTEVTESVDRAKDTMATERREPEVHAMQIDDADSLESTVYVDSDNSSTDSAARDNESDRLEEIDNDDATRTNEAIASRKASEALHELEDRLLNEQCAHEETAKHLRITRKALSVLELESRNFELEKADSIIQLEDKLARAINLQAEHEATATRETDRRIELETAVVKLKRDLVKAKQDIRRSTAARAKALSTANKSIAFARQAIQTRAQLEAELDQARAALKNRQTTISSLISELEKEKQKTREEISDLARQQVLHEKELKARRSLEQVARSVENKLTSRLVKKVAKARPLISDL